MKQKKRRRLLWLCVAALVIGAVALLVTNTLPTLRQSVQEQGRTALRDTILRTAMECYAVEGVYPPNVTYMEQHYGLSINHSVYVISYDVFASNILPSVQVMVRGEE